HRRLLPQVSACGAVGNVRSRLPGLGPGPSRLLPAKILVLRHVPRQLGIATQSDRAAVADSSIGESDLGVRIPPPATAGFANSRSMKALKPGASSASH